MPKGDKYIDLKEYLFASKAPVIKLSFEQIESILHFPLPASAVNHAEAGWSNNNDHS